MSGYCDVLVLYTMSISPDASLPLLVVVAGVVEAPVVEGLVEGDVHVGAVHGDAVDRTGLTSPGRGGVSHVES